MRLNTLARVRCLVKEIAYTLAHVANLSNSFFVQAWAAIVAAIMPAPLAATLPARFPIAVDVTAV